MVVPKLECREPSRALLRMASLSMGTLSRASFLLAISSVPRMVCSVVFVVLILEKNVLDCPPRWKTPSTSSLCSFVALRSFYSFPVVIHPRTCSWNFFFRSSFPVAPRVAVVTLLSVVCLLFFLKWPPRPQMSHLNFFTGKFLAGRRTLFKKKTLNQRNEQLPRIFPPFQITTIAATGSGQNTKKNPPTTPKCQA